MGRIVQYLSHIRTWTALDNSTQGGVQLSAYYGLEKLTEAVRQLACTEGRLRDRLGSTWPGNLELLSLHRLPWPDLDERYEIIRADFAPALPGSNSLRHWPDEDVQRLAGDIFALFYEVFRRSRDDQAGDFLGVR